MNPTEPVDQLLSAYFRHELPNPWPKFQPPLAAPPAAAREWSGSRWALAASVAALAGACWVLSGATPGGPQLAKPAGIKDSTAQPGTFIEKVRDALKSDE
jgi:hypothetical protein